jgi:hypothetical protein
MSLDPSKLTNEQKHEICYSHYVISDSHSNEMPNVNTLNERRERESSILFQTIVSILWVFIMFWCLYVKCRPITVAARSKAWIVFARSNAGIVGSNPSQDMNVCLRLFCVCVILCVGIGLATGWSPVQGVLPTVYRIKKLKSGQGETKGL